MEPLVGTSSTAREDLQLAPHRPTTTDRHTDRIETDTQTGVETGWDRDERQTDKGSDRAIKTGEYWQE